MAPERGRPTKRQDDLFDWFTVTYRSIYTTLGLVALLVIGGFAVYHIRHGGAPPQSPQSPVPTVTTAHFTSIEGNVKVKAVGTFEWVTADTSMILQKSDVVRTGSGSAAEITFSTGP